jgi:hypothetical protein
VSSQTRSFSTPRPTDVIGLKSLGCLPVDAPDLVYSMAAETLLLIEALEQQH